VNRPPRPSSISTIYPVMADPPLLEIASKVKETDVSVIKVTIGGLVGFSGKSAAMTEI